MVTSRFLILLAVVATAAQAKSADHRNAPTIRNEHKRHAQNRTLASRDLHPGPFTGGHGTWFNVEENEVDCGGFYKHTDFVVALNQPQYGNLDARSPYCNRYIEITANGKTATAKVVDACPESSGACHFGSLDMSIGLFQFFDSLDKGVIDIKWSLKDGSDGDGGDNGNGDDGSNNNKPPAPATSKMSVGSSSQHQPTAKTPQPPLKWKAQVTTSKPKQSKPKNSSPNKDPKGNKDTLPKSTSKAASTSKTTITDTKTLTGTKALTGTKTLTGTKALTGTKDTGTKALTGTTTHHTDQLGKAASAVTPQEPSKKNNIAGMRTVQHNLVALVHHASEHHN
ncbi:hypothetical protein CF319_g6721 [Tilletia indica]|nr:hypothetical protein CF319_g6721 [Tilletia indica]